MHLVRSLTAGDFLGPNQLVQPLSRGGMSDVWLARTGPAGTLCVVKTASPSTSDRQTLEAVYDELRVASRLRHENLVSFLEGGLSDGTPYLSLEWIEGESLKAWMRAARARGARMPAAVAARVVIDAARGLHAAHELVVGGIAAGLVHRDISPENIIVRVGGVAKVIDFGMAKSDHIARAVRTESGTVKGKLRYLAPEQILGGNVDRRADIRALALVYHALVAVELPFRRDSASETARAIVRGDSPGRVHLHDDHVRAVLDRALAVDPKDRYATAAELADAFERAVPEARRALGAVVSWANEHLLEERNRRRSALRHALAVLDGAAGRAASEPSPQDALAGSSALDVAMRKQMHTMPMADAPALGPAPPSAPPAPRGRAALLPPPPFPAGLSERELRALIPDAPIGDLASTLESMSLVPAVMSLGKLTPRGHALASTSSLPPPDSSVTSSLLLARRPSRAPAPSRRRSRAPLVATLALAAFVALASLALTGTQSVVPASPPGEAPSLDELPARADEPSTAALASDRPSPSASAAASVEAAPSSAPKHHGHRRRAPRAERPEASTEPEAPPAPRAVPSTRD